MGVGVVLMALAVLLGSVWGCTGIQTRPGPTEAGTSTPDGGGSGGGAADHPATVVDSGPLPDAPRGLVDGEVPEVTEPIDAPCLHEIKAVVRDFRGYAGTAGARHPDFEGPAFTSAKGIVQPMLGADQKPAYAPAGATPGTTGKAEFDQWYRDVASVNMRFDDIVLPLMTDPARPNVYVYDDQMFFPIDGRGWDDGFGNNFHFTTEIHIEFPYKGGEVFTFKGDDDLFLFINGHLAIDLGGVHPAQTDSVDLDARANELGIQKGQVYKMDIFHAERHTTFSTFRIETTISCLTSIIIP